MKPHNTLAQIQIIQSGKKAINSNLLKYLVDKKKQIHFICECSHKLMSNETKPNK